MAIGAAELHGGACRSAANWLHVDRVIELDRARTTRGVRDQRCKFRMPVFEAANVGCVMGRTAVGRKIGMAYRAGLIADSGNINPAFVRSEEHTSELQSRSDLVCRLLLEKK